MYTRKYAICFTLIQVLLICTLKTNINLHSIKNNQCKIFCLHSQHSTVTLLLFRITLPTNDLWEILLVGSPPSLTAQAPGNIHTCRGRTHASPHSPSRHSNPATASSAVRHTKPQSRHFTSARQSCRPPPATWRRNPQHPGGVSIWPTGSPPTDAHQKHNRYR